MTNQVKKSTKAKILRWVQNGYSIDEIMPYVPTLTRQHVEAIIRESEKKERQ
ncbi:DUF433 domain-containing protein [Bifidobacterium vansinderenii]|uniref:Antitoxin n=1 Tax=Bifidobacterium vansinderenii TaxID=1984871 RepID=A0A229VWC9_9BIFI|nr:DUF433 domain-containing protein [Bifidobacterium vansinderenii]OXM99901.1 hypothetical protein Tam10B_1864 [Bifidobacterium vansinderenii]